MKKLVAVFTAVIIAATFSGCGSRISDAVDDIVLTVASQRTTEELMNNIYNAFKERDSAALEGVFCPKIAHEHELSKEISEAFSLIDGNIISYKKINTQFPNNGSFHWENNLCSNLESLNTIADIKTDSGAVYFITVMHCVKYADNDSYKGVFEIRVLRSVDGDKDELLCRIGSEIEAYIEKEIPTEYRTEELEAISIGYVDKWTKLETNNMLVALQNRDVDAVFSLFAENVRCDELKQKLDDAVALIDGNLVSYSNAHGDYSGESVDYGTLTYFSGEIEIYDIKTDSGCLYEIQIFDVDIDEDDPDNEGIYCLSIKKVDSRLIDFEHEIIAEVTVRI